MAAIKGSLVKIKRGNADGPPETFDVIAGSRNVRGSINNNPIDITSADDVVPAGTTWRNSIAGIVDFEVSVDAIIKDKATFNQLIADTLADTTINYQVEIEGFGTFEGPLMIGGLDFTGQFDEAATYSLALSARGVQNYTPAP